MDKIRHVQMACMVYTYIWGKSPEKKSRKIALKQILIKEVGKDYHDSLR